MSKWLKSAGTINFALILSSAVFLILLFAFISRIYYPRVSPERTQLETHLISNVIQVEILNGCGVAGIATRFTNEMRNAGFDVVESGNFERFDLEHSFVIDRIGNLDQARMIARALGIDENRIIRETSPDYFLDATIVIGHDYEFLLR